MTAHRRITQVDEKNGIELKNLPFSPGQKVEVIVFANENDSKINLESGISLLSGTLIKYEDPYSPSTESQDWESNL